MFRAIFYVVWLISFTGWTVYLCWDGFGWWALLTGSCALVSLLALVGSRIEAVTPDYYEQGLAAEEKADHPSTILSAW